MGRTIRRIRRSVQKIAALAGLDEPDTELAEDIVLGISRSSSCHLSMIARVLNKDGPLIDTERWLSEGLSDPGSKMGEMAAGYLEVVAPTAAKMPFIIVDLTEIAKPYGKAFEYLDTIRNASDPRKHLEPGYWSVRIDAADEAHHHLPLWTQVFSTVAPGYLGWNDTFFEAMNHVVEAVGRDNTWLFDRAFDSLDHYHSCKTLRIKWVVRQKQNRNLLLANGNTCLMERFALGLHKPHPTAVPYVDKSTHELKHCTVHFGYAPVELPGLDVPCTLIVITGLRADDMVLLTNHRITRPKHAARLVRAYMRRWGVEDGIRFWKQKTNIEDFRVRCWQSIQHLALLSMIATGIQALWLLRAPALAGRFISRVKVFIEHVLFRNYRLWDGVAAALFAEA